MAVLRVYVAADCASCATARERVAQVRHLRPGQAVESIDLNEPGATRPAYVFGTPTYCLDDQVIALGNPSLLALLAQIDGVAPAAVAALESADRQAGG